MSGKSAWNTIQISTIHETEREREERGHQQGHGRRQGHRDRTPAHQAGGIAKEDGLMRPGL